MIQMTELEKHYDIANLRRQLAQRETVADYLLIAHPDRRMIKRVVGAMAPETVSCFSLDQSSWDFSRPHWRELFAWAIDQQVIGRLILMGHSDGLLSAEQFQPARRGVRNLLGQALDQHASQRWGQRLDAQRHFAQEVRQLQLQILPLIEESSKFEIDTLFYRAEAGVFTKYDPIENRFQVIGEV